ncbi:MAG: hypothetical protein J6Y42_00855 [Bacilli bacterium]|nr:hypothetical protein [Bacilli bacterium]
MGNEIIIECSNPECTDTIDLTFKEALIQSTIRTDEILEEIKDVELEKLNLFDLNFYDFMLNKNLHQISIIDIFIKWNLFNYFLENIDLDKQFEQIKELHDERFNVLFLENNSKFLILQYGTKPVLNMESEEDTDYLERKIIYIQRKPFLDYDEISKNIHELNLNPNRFKDKEDHEKHFLKLLDYYQKSKELRKSIIDSMEGFEEYPEWSIDLLVKGSNLEDIVEVLQYFINMEEEDLAAIEEG